MHAQVEFTFPHAQKRHELLGQILLLVLSSAFPFAASSAFTLFIRFQLACPGLELPCPHRDLVSSIHGDVLENHLLGGREALDGLFFLHGLGNFSVRFLLGPLEKTTDLLLELARLSSGFLLRFSQFLVGSSPSWGELIGKQTQGGFSSIHQGRFKLAFGLPQATQSLRERQCLKLVQVLIDHGLQVLKCLQDFLFLLLSFLQRLFLWAWRGGCGAGLL